MKKDNLKRYREEKVKKNLELVKRAIVHLKKFKIGVSLSNVSKVTYDIANDEEKGLTVAALSQNKLYKNLIKKEQNDQDLSKSDSNKEHSSKTLKQMGEVELIAEIYKLRSKIIEQENENKILKDIMSEYKIEDKKEKTNGEMDCKELSLALEHILEVLLDKEILYLDSETFDVKLSVYRTHVLNGYLFKKIFKESKNANKKGSNSL